MRHRREESGRGRRVWRFALLLAALAPLAAGAETTTSAAATPGQRVYESRCYYCHGYSGDARTAAADVLQPPPRDFTALDPSQLPREQMLAAIRDGRPGTAMQGFAGLLPEAEIEAVADYIRARLMAGGRATMRYHSVANGWTGNPQDSPAAPWVLGTRSLEEPWEGLDESSRRGRHVYLQACISCHTPVDRRGPQTVWRNLAISYPPGNYVEDEHHDPQAMAAEPTAVFERHEDPLPPAGNDPLAVAGQALYLQACADCHAGNGSGRNWVGSFIDPPPPDLRDADAASVHSREALAAVIRGGVPGSAMPAFGGVLDEQQVLALTRYFEAAFRPLGSP